MKHKHKPSSEPSRRPILPPPKPRSAHPGRLATSPHETIPILPPTRRQLFVDHKIKKARLASPSPSRSKKNAPFEDIESVKRKKALQSIGNEVQDFASDESESAHAANEWEIIVKSQTDEIAKLKEEILTLERYGKKQLCRPKKAAAEADEKIATMENEVAQLQERIREQDDVIMELRRISQTQGELNSRLREEVQKWQVIAAQKDAQMQNMGFAISSFALRSGSESTPSPHLRSSTLRDYN